jgi:hypothetical protein
MRRPEGATVSADEEPVDLLARLAETIMLFMNAGPAFPADLLYIVIGSIPVTLVHELGHALVARKLLRGDVRVSLGTAGKLAELKLGQIALSGNALAHPARLPAPPSSTGREPPRATCS